jgi:Na+/proline symporter
MGLLYLGWIRLFEWDTDQKWLPYLGLWAIGVVMGGSVCVNAMSFDAMRVRAALDSGARLWHLLIIKNLALACLVAPIGFLLCGLLAWRAGDIYAFYKGCALMICMILLWLGVGNVLSVALPSRDEPIKKRKESGSLKQFLIAFVVSYLIGYLVNGMLVWRIFAAQDLANRLGSALLPAIIIIVSSAFMWILLTIVAAALAQQPKVHRLMQKEITDYKANAEALAFAEEEAAAKAALTDRKESAGAVSS